jgi:hypothetical protein
VSARRPAARIALRVAVTAILAVIVVIVAVNLAVTLTRHRPTSACVSASFTPGPGGKPDVTYNPAGCRP